MFINELLNRINVNLSSERLLSDFCTIMSIKGNKAVVSYLNKNIIMSDVYLVGYTSVKEGDVGVILLVGFEKRGVFLPLYRGRIKPSVPETPVPEKFPE